MSSELEIASILENEKLMDLLLKIFDGRLYAMDSKHENKWFQSWPGNSYLNKLSMEDMPYMSIDLVGVVRFSTPKADVRLVESFTDLTPWPFRPKGFVTLNDDLNELEMVIEYTLNTEEGKD